MSGQGYSSKVDLWALGCIVYEMLCGKTPFATSISFSELFKRIAEGRYPAPKHGSDAARNFIAELLEPDPEARLSAVQALEHPWITQSQGRSRMLSGVQVFWKEGGTLSTVVPVESGIGLEQLSLSDY